GRADRQVTLFNPRRDVARWLGRGWPRGRRCAAGNDGRRWYERAGPRRGWEAGCECRRGDGFGHAPIPRATRLVWQYHEQRVVLEQRQLAGVRQFPIERDQCMNIVLQLV